MKEVTTSSKAIPANPRSKNYPAGASVVHTGGGNATIIQPGGGSDVDIIKSTDSKSATDKNVLSALKSILEFLSKNEDGTAKGVIDFLNGIKLNGGSLDGIIKKGEETSPSDSKVFSSLRTISEILANNEELLKKVLRKDQPDQTEHLLKLLGGTFVRGGIDTDSITSLTAEIEKFTERTTFEKGATTLNLLVQELATIYDLDVTHVATMFRTVIKDYVSSETFIPGLMGEGMKIYKALSGDWNLEIDNVVIRKVMTIFELVVSKIRSVNGGLVISAANGRIKSVAETTGDPAYYVLGIEGDNQFVFDDLVRCQVFTSGQAKYYWVPVASVTADSILILKSEFTNGVVPAPGDDLVQMGNRTNKARQGFLYLTASEDGKPRFSVMDGVNSTSTVGKSKVILGCLDGMTDTDFPADFQPSGWGLYAMNVFLKGVFLLRNGKSVEGEIESAKSDAQTAKDKAELVTRLLQEFTMAGGIFESKITEVKKYADDKANTAKNEAINDASGKYNTKSEVSSLISQTKNEINLSVTEKISNVQTQITANASAIEVNRQGITLKASQEQVNGIGNRLTIAESSLTVQAGQISAAVSSVDNLSGRMSSAEFKLDPSQIWLGITGKVGEEIESKVKAGIGITSGGITVFGKVISLVGAVTFSSLDGDSQNRITAAQNTANAANGAAGTAQSTANDAVNKANVAQGTANTGVANAGAAQGTANDAWNRANNAQTSASNVDSALGTLRNSLGGMAYDNVVTLAKLDSTIIEGGYIKTDLINARAIVTDVLSAESITATNLTVTGNSKIGDFRVNGGSLSAEHTQAVIGFIYGNNSASLGAGSLIVDKQNTGYAIRINGGAGIVRMDIDNFEVIASGGMSITNSAGTALSINGKIKANGAFGTNGYYEFPQVWNGGWRKAAFSFTNGILTNVGWY